MKFHSLIFFIIVTVSSYAQTINCNIDLDAKFVREPLLRYSLKETKSFFDGNNIIRIENPGIKEVKFYTAKYSGQTHAIIIRKFDDKGNEVLVNKLEKGKKNFGPLSAATIEFNSKILLFYARYESKDSMKLYFSEIDKTDLSLKNTKFLFSYLQDNVGLLGLGKLLGREILLRKSPDASKLLFGVRGDGKDWFSCIIDKDLSIIRKKTSSLPIEKNENVIDGIVENGGNCILLFADLVEVSAQDLSSFSDMYSTTNGLLIQKMDNTEKFIKYNTIGPGGKPCNIHFKISKDYTQTYMFGDYSRNSGIEGIWLTHIETNEFKIGEPELFAYPNDVKKEFSDLGFDLGKKITILKARFSLVEFDDGSMAICGHIISPWYGGVDRHGSTAIGFFGGPLITAFIDKGSMQCKFSVLPRKMNDPAVGDGIYIPFRDKLVIIYNDFTNNLIRDSVQAKGGKVNKEDNTPLSLGYVVLRKDGTVEIKKMLANRRELKSDLSTNEYLKIADNKWLIPSRYYDQKNYDHRIAIITIE